MMKRSFDPLQPNNDLPLIPPQNAKFETIEILKQEARSRAALAELKGFAHIVPNQAILVNAVVLREAQDSSEIENIITTQDEIYRAIALGSNGNLDPAAKEVVRYREALWQGTESIKKRGILSINDLVTVQQIIIENDAGIRKNPGTALVNDKSGEVIYTPPQGEQRINKLLRNLTDYLNDGEGTLIKSAILHYQFETVHPFYDGNGRTGRIMNILYLILKRHIDTPILYLSSYIIENKAEYYRLLLRVTTDEEWQPWILYFLKGIEVTAKETIAKIQRMKELMDETIEYVRKTSPRIYSKELVETLFLHPYCKSVFVENGVGIERKAASRYLHQLNDTGVLEIVRIGRENLYINKKLMELLKDKRCIPDV